MTTDLALHARTKHIKLDLYFIREKVLQGEIDIIHVPSYDQVAEILTKAISSPSILMLRSKLSVESLATLSLRGAINKAGSITFGALSKVFIRGIFKLKKKKKRI